MGNGYDVKITVLRRFDPAEVFEKSPVTSDQPIKACGLFKDFQEFIVPGHDPKVPNGFCSAAWASIFPYVLSLSSGGECYWFNEKNVAIAACIDGLRPVIFKLERYDSSLSLVFFVAIIALRRREYVRVAECVRIEFLFYPTNLRVTLRSSPANLI